MSPVTGRAAKTILAVVPRAAMGNLQTRLSVGWNGLTRTQRKWRGKCGHKMVVRYKGGSQYVCNHLHMQHGHVVPVCQTLRSAAIDARVAEAFLQAVSPAEMAAWSDT